MINYLITSGGKKPLLSITYELFYKLRPVGKIMYYKVIKNKQFTLPE